MVGLLIQDAIFSFLSVKMDDYKSYKYITILLSPSMLMKATCIL